MNNFCKVCNKAVPYDQDHYDQRFLYGYCDTHKNVPPAYMDKAIEQFCSSGSTEWDVSKEFSK